MLIENLHVEANAFLGGESVHVAADRVNLAGNVFGTAVLRALEHHVLNKMGDPVPLGIFVAGAGFDPNPDGDGANVLHLLRNHREAIRQDFASDVPYVFNHGVVPTGRGREYPARFPVYSYTLRTGVLADISVVYNQ